MTSGIVTEKNLLRLSIIVSLVGLLFLYLYATEISLEPITKIDTIPVDSTVTIQGRVSKVSNQDTIAFLEVDNEKIEQTTVILFKDHDVWIHEGDVVEITGTVEEYEGKQEIIGNKVIVKGR